MQHTEHVWISGTRVALFSERRNRQTRTEKLTNLNQMIYTNNKSTFFVSEGRVDNVISAWSKNKYHNFKRFFTKDIEEIKLLVISSLVYIVKKHS